jgi:hypothetical protein
MPSVTYVARRELASGHFEGTEYSLEFDIANLQRPTGGDLKTKSKSLDGTTETLYFGKEKIWSVTTVPEQISSEQAELLYEFLDSTADGQTFTFDPYDDGTGFQVSREDEGYEEVPFSPINGVDDYAQFSFQVREV